MENNAGEFEIVERDKWGMNTNDAFSDQLARFGITAYVPLNEIDSILSTMTDTCRKTGDLDKARENMGRLLKSFTAGLKGRNMLGMDSPYEYGDELASSKRTSLSSGAEKSAGISDVSMVIIASNGRLYNTWLKWNHDKIAPDGSKGYYELWSRVWVYDPELLRRKQLPEWQLKVMGIIGPIRRDRYRKFTPWVEGQPIPDSADECDEGWPVCIQAMKLLNFSITSEQEKKLEKYLLSHSDPDNSVRNLKKVVTKLQEFNNVSDESGQ